MKKFSQAYWDEPLLKELSRRGRVGTEVPCDAAIRSRFRAPASLVPKSMRRESVNLPELSELQVLRHFNRLSQMNYSVELGMYPLGSCTMKYNPKVSEVIASSDSMKHAHPLQPRETAQGLLSIFYELERYLSEITGMHRFSLSTAAGAQGELAGVLMIRKYQREHHGEARDEVLVPDSAHGTNPASAAMGGFRVVKVPSDASGQVRASTVRSLCSEKTAGMMFTVPNTLGLFESEVAEVCGAVHDAGGLMYYDGANMNALLGRARPGDMGFDIVHLNLHKTFATPHGGGGPGAGPVGVAKKLADYLPVPVIAKAKDGYSLDYSLGHSIGALKGFVGNSAVLLRAYVYIRLLGASGLADVSSLAVLAANYLWKSLDPEAFPPSHGPDLRRKHEAVVSVKSELPGAAMTVAKAILDYGMHSPTVYFPLIVHEALMIEPTESEPLEMLDEYAAALNQIHREMKDGTLGTVPKNTSVGKVDEVKASHPLTLKVHW
ncbi:MAG: aminomethyl-transferring glycine dehydrogenase subunit GcvPB [Nitrososphaerota archaeon]|nr:aminomethyl-transferring glycine dehydrogenase subunit GcvPB [Nitrososphaerota archaeon]MDG7024007.1 aminomethyl-transferring glycine dehydrogenase subunit GcvPB [Nitrososphaerota archaeon]